MRFMDSYKRLDKLCGEIMNSTKGVSSYIEEMQNTPHATHYVTGWNEDLKKLKHYRWVRNNIVHEPGCTEQDMCESGDTLWINKFHSRIMNQNDPLALYYKATKKQNNFTSSAEQTKPPHIKIVQNKNHTQQAFKRFVLATVISFLIIILAIICIIYFSSQFSFNYI